MDLIGRFYDEIQTTEDICILRGLHFIVKSAYQVRTVELNYNIADEITSLWQQCRLICKQTAFEYPWLRLHPLLFTVKWASVYLFRWILRQYYLIYIPWIYGQIRYFLSLIWHDNCTVNYCKLFDIRCFRTQPKRLEFLRSLRSAAKRSDHLFCSV